MDSERNTKPLLIGIADAARLLGISRRGMEVLVARLAAAGVLHEVRLGRRRLLRMDELEGLARRGAPAASEGCGDRAANNGDRPDASSSIVNRTRRLR